MLDLEHENLFDCCHLPQQPQEVAVNKSELIEKVAGASGLEKKQAEAAVVAFVDSVVTTVKAGDPVSIFGFGSFKPQSRAARVGRNPQTNAAVKIAAKKVVKFVPATAFKTALNARGTKKAAASTKKTAATKTAAAKSTATKTAAVKTSVKKAPAKTAPAKKMAAPVTKAAAATKKSPVAKKVAAPAKKVAGSAKKR
jgi:DNA-binding protein HU-beta